MNSHGFSSGNNKYNNSYRRRNDTLSFAEEEMEETEVHDEIRSNYVIMPTKGSSSNIHTTPMKQSQSPQSKFSKIINTKKPFYINGTRYNVLQKIGQGDISKIYKVFDNEGNFYAVKKVNYGTSQVILDCYLNEIQLLQELQDNDRIIKIIDSEINTAERLILILLELGDNDLKSIISSQENISPNYVRYTWQQMLEAVQVIHDRKIIHGNLKPSNFLMVKGTLKLIDFGFAKVIQNDATSTEIYHQCNAIQYRAPESFTGTSQAVKLGTSADVWSIGCILYELVYGHSPFPKIGMQFTRGMHNINFEPLPQFPDFSLLKDVIERCLQSNPKQRPSIEKLLMHPYIQPSDSYFAKPVISTEKNLTQFIKQIKDKYNDSEFNCKAGQIIIKRVVKELINGREMKISCSRSDYI